MRILVWTYLNVFVARKSPAKSRGESALAYTTLAGKNDNFLPYAFHPLLYQW